MIGLNNINFSYKTVQIMNNLCSLSFKKDITFDLGSEQVVAVLEKKMFQVDKRKKKT